MQVQNKNRKTCEKRKRNFTLETLKLIDPESIEVNPVVDSVLFCLSFLGLTWFSKLEMFKLIDPESIEADPVVDLVLVGIGVGLGVGLGVVRLTCFSNSFLNFK